MSWASRLRHLRRRVLDDDLDVELQSYFDIQIERRMAAVCRAKRRSVSYGSNWKGWTR